MAKRSDADAEEGVHACVCFYGIHLLVSPLEFPISLSGRFRASLLLHALET